MRAAELLLACCAISVTLRAADPQDYFENLRDKAFVEFDQPYLARNKDVPPDAPPLFRARHLILRLKSYGEEERRWWPQRDLLLVEMPSGRRWVIESTSPKFDFNHLDEETPSRRVSTDGGVVESFYAPDVESLRREGSADDDPCSGPRFRVRGGGHEIFGISIDDWRSRTVSVAIAEIRQATFSVEEVEELARLLPMELPRIGGDLNSGLGLRLAWTLLFTDRPMQSPEQRNILLVPDAASAGDLAPWRTLTYLPQDLPPFPPLPAEGGIK